MRLQVALVVALLAATFLGCGDAGPVDPQAHWSAGRAQVAEGERMLSKGEALLARGQALVSAGRALVEAGSQTLKDRERMAGAVSEAEPAALERFEAESAGATAQIRDGNEQVAEGTALIEEGGRMIREARTLIETGKRAMQRALEQSMTIGLHDAISREAP